MSIGKGVAYKLRSVHQANDVLLAIRRRFDEFHHTRQDGGERNRLVAIPKDVMIGGHRAPPGDGVKLFQLLRGECAANSAMADNATVTPRGGDIVAIGKSGGHRSE